MVSFRIDVPTVEGRTTLPICIPTSWSGTADDLAAEVARVARELGLSIQVPSVRTIRLWRTKRLLGRDAGRRFERRQLLEALAAAVLFDRGWSTTAIVDRFAGCSEADLEQTLGEAVSTASSGAGGPPPRESNRRATNDTAEEAAILLAQGILLQYRRLLTGREIVRQSDDVPAELQSAMCYLGRLYIEQGDEDRAACIHDVLERARYPLGSSEWGLAPFGQGFRFSSALLIDPLLKVPTSDCAAIATIRGGMGEDNVIESRLHTRLRETAERFGSRRHEAYTGIRELLTRFSLVDERKLIEFLDQRDLSPVLQTVVEEFYERVPEAWLIRQRAHRCVHCQTLMRPHPDKRTYPDGICPIRQCAARSEPQVGEQLDWTTAPLLIAKPQVLAYWTGPGIDELLIFNEACRLGLSAELYPESDLCDVGIEGRAIGIDAKSYSSPISLGLRLNRGIGGLINYRRRIVAVGDDLLSTNPDYISMLRSVLEPRGDQSTLEILDVSSVLTMLRRLRHAPEA